MPAAWEEAEHVADDALLTDQEHPEARERRIKAAIDSALVSLAPKHHSVLVHRYGLDGTLKNLWIK